MVDYLLLLTLLIMSLGICTDIYRVNQIRRYIEQNKKILCEMELKRKEIYELSILIQKLGEINETINDNHT